MFKSPSEHPSYVVPLLVTLGIIVAVAMATFFVLYADRQAAPERSAASTSAPSVKDARDAAAKATPSAGSTTTTGTDSTGSATSTTIATSQLYFVAMEDNGKSGTLIGCGDSLVGTQTTLDFDNQLARGINLMLSEVGDYYGQSGWYNPLGAHAEDLELESADITEDGTALIRFTGSLANVAHCEVPRFQEQVETFAKQFTGVKRVQIEVNGDLFETLTDERG